MRFIYRLNGDKVATFQRRYDGGRTTYHLGRLPRVGVYDVKVKFDSKPANSAYMNCSNSFEQRQRGKR